MRSIIRSKNEKVLNHLKQSNSSLNQLIKFKQSINLVNSKIKKRKRPLPSIFDNYLDNYINHNTLKYVMKEWIIFYLKDVPNIAVTECGQMGSYCKKLQGSI